MQPTVSFELCFVERLKPLRVEKFGANPIAE